MIRHILEEEKADEDENMKIQRPNENVKLPSSEKDYKAAIEAQETPTGVCAIGEGRDRRRREDQYSDPSALGTCVSPIEKSNKSKI